jgi:hypothetical protein
MMTQSAPGRIRGAAAIPIRWMPGINWKELHRGIIKGSTDERPCFESSLSNRRSSDNKELPNPSKTTRKPPYCGTIGFENSRVEAVLRDAVAAEYCL